MPDAKDIEFNTSELNIMYYATELFRDMINQELENFPLNRDNCLNNLAYANSAMRKLKKILGDNLHKV